MFALEPFRRPLALALGLGAAAAATPAAAVAQQAERYALAGSSIGIYNLVGTVSIEAGSGSAVTVEVRRGGADAARLSVERGTVRGRETLRIIYPSDRIRASSMGRHDQTQLRVRDDGTWGDEHDDRRASEGRRVTISGDDGLDARADLRILVPAGRNVAVYQAVGAVTARGVAGDLDLNTASAGVTASGIRGDLSIDVGSGDVEASGVEGALSIDTGSGDVTVSDVRGGRDLSIDTGSGEVRVTGAVVGRGSFDTGSGRIIVSGLQATDATFDTGSGAVDVAVGSGLRRLSIDTGSGDVTVRAPADFGAAVHVEASSGDIDTDFPVTLTHKEEGELDGRIGDGRTTLQIDTGSGDVRLVRAGR